MSCVTKSVPHLLLATDVFGRETFSFSIEMLIADKYKKVGVSTPSFPLVNNEWPSSLLQNSVFLEMAGIYSPNLKTGITTIPEKTAAPITQINDFTERGLSAQLQGLQHNTYI